MRFLRDTYIWAALATLILTGLAVFFFQGNFLTIDSDLTYHVATAQSFVKNGGITLWENWDSLPEGRPHLYPPVFHIVVAAIVATGAAPLAVLKIINLVAILGLLVLSWLAITKLFGTRVGLVYILLATSSVSFVRIIGTTIPASIVIFLSPYLIIFLKQKRILPATLLLSVFFCTHMIFPWVIIAGLIIWTYFNPEYRLAAKKTIYTAILLYLPWLLYVAGNLEYLRYFSETYTTSAKVTLSHVFSLNIFLFFIAALIIISERWKKEGVQKDLIFFLALALISLPIAYLEFGRYSYSIGFWTMAIIVSYVVCEYFPRSLSRAEKIVALAVCLFVFIFSIQMTVTKGVISSSIRQHLLFESLNTHARFYIGTPRFGHINPANTEIGTLIASLTPPDGTIMSFADKLEYETYFEHRRYVLPQLFAALSGRNMASLRYPELYWQQTLNPRQADILLVNTYQIDENLIATSPEGNTVDLKENFELVYENLGGLRVYKNLHPEQFALPDGHILMPLWLGWLVLLIALVFIIVPIKIKRFKR